MKVGLAGSRSETKVVGGWTPRSANAVLDDVAVAVIEVTADDVAEIDDSDDEGNEFDEVVRVVEASVDDDERGNDELVAVTGLDSGVVETAEIEAMEVVDTGEVELNESDKFNVGK